MIGWLMEAYPETRPPSDRHDLCAGTVDSWLPFKPTGGAIHATDAGNASSLMTLTETPIRSRSGLSTTVAWRRSKKVSYALEGNISVSAQAAAWMADLMGLADVAALTELATRAKGDVNVCFVPALAGLGAPYWKD